MLQKPNPPAHTIPSVIPTVIAGAGASGLHIHRPLLEALSGFSLVGFYSRHKAPGWDPALPHSTDWGQLLEQSGARLAIIATPPASHYSLARGALEAGCHVVVEKPFVLEARLGRELMDLARDRGLLLTVFQNRRWDSDFLLLKELLASGRLGSLISSEWNHESYRPQLRPKVWKEQDPGQGSILEDLGSHFLDQALALFGTPRSLTAFEAVQRPESQVADSFRLGLDYGNHSLWIQASLMVCRPGPRYRIQGSLATFEKYGQDPQEAQLKQGLSPTDPGYGLEPPDQAGRLYRAPSGQAGGEGAQAELLPSPRGNYGQFYAQLAACLAGKGPLPVDPADSLRVVELLEAACRSLGEKITVLL